MKVALAIQTYKLMPMHRGSSTACLLHQSILLMSTEISLTVAKYYGSSVFNPSIMRSDFRKGKTLRLSMSLPEGLRSPTLTGLK